MPRRRHAVGVGGDGPLGCVFLGTAQGREHDRDRNTHVPLARGFFFSFLSFFKPVTCCLSRGEPSVGGSGVFPTVLLLLGGSRCFVSTSKVQWSQPQPPGVHFKRGHVLFCPAVLLIKAELSVARSPRNGSLSEGNRLGRVAHAASRSQPGPGRDGSRRAVRPPSPCRRVVVVRMPFCVWSLPPELRAPPLTAAAASGSQSLDPVMLQGAAPRPGVGPCARV